MIINETTLSNLNDNLIVKNKLQISKPTVFLVIPDSNVDLINFLPNLKFYLSQAAALISPSQIFTIGNKLYNGKKQNLKIKQEMRQQSDFRKIKVVSNLPQLQKLKSDEKIFYLYDLTLLSEAYNTILSKYSPKKAALILFSELQDLYKLIKKQNPTINVVPLFLIKNTEGNLYNLFTNIKINLPLDTFQKLSFYSSKTLIHTPSTVFPIFSKNKDDENIVIIKNINKLSSLLTEIKIEGKKKIEKIKSTEIVTFLSKDKSISATIDNKKLAKLLKAYKITNPDIVANVNNSIQNYLKSGGKLDNLSASELVFKAINKTLYNTDEINPDFIAHPEKLLNKIQNINNNRTPLNFSPVVTNQLINPKKVVNIDYTTSAWRQKYEFEESIHKNIEKLFSTLEQTSDHPVKVKKIKHEIIDNNTDRIIQYTITLQNTSGKNKKPYDVILNIPGIINDRYVKLNGSHYIMSNQQFMKPITKTEKNKVRILSNYAIIHLSLENSKFDLSNIEKILLHIQLKYPTLIKTKNDDECIFSDGSIIRFYDEIIYEDKFEQFKYDKETNKIYNKDGQAISKSKYELIYEKVIEQIHNINPNDSLGKTSKSLQYIAIYIGGLKLPFIIYLWQQKGLLSTLNDLEIDYEKISNIDEAKTEYIIKLKNNEFLCLLPDSEKQKFICNGLLVFKLKKSIENLDDPTEIHPLINQYYGQLASRNLKLLNDYEIDPVTKELLEFENLPTNLSTLISTYCLEKLLNGKIEDLSDLRIYRTRLSEMMLNIVYKQLTMAHNEYRKKIDLQIEDAKINIMPDYVIKNIYSQPGVLQYTTAPTPIEGITLASQTIKTGPNGVPNEFSFKKEHRNINPSQIGNLAALTTPESKNVGLNVSHTLTPTIINDFGNYSINDPSSLSGFEAVSINEALTPFINEGDSDRMTMATTHAKQNTPSDGNEPPLVGTGAEYIVSELSSKRFIEKASKNGIVSDIDPNKTLTVTYEDGTKEIFDIIPRLSKTYMGAYIQLEMKTPKKGEKVQAGQPVAWTKNFNKYGMYCAGKNATIAVMQYNGLVYEDAYLISDDMANSLKRDIIKQIQIIIPPNTKVIKLENQINKEITNKDVLVEFMYPDTLNDYLQTYNLIDQSDDTIDESNYNQSDNTIKLMGKNGQIVDIKIFINNKNKVDKQIITNHKKLAEETLKTLKKLEKSYTNKDDKIKARDNLSLEFLTFGNHKLSGGAEFEGARIVFYIKQQETLQIGDKLASRYGAKGCISHIMDKKNNPYTKDNTMIDVFISPVGLFSRKNIAMLKEIYLSKVIYYLDKQIKEQAKDVNIPTRNIIKLIIDVYETLGIEELVDSIKDYFKNTKSSDFRQMLKTDEDFQLTFLVPPFKTVKFKDIKNAAKLINIELDEYVYLPEFKTWTKDKVPVGKCYMQSLEQTSKSYVNARSNLGKYNYISGQPVKGKSKSGGQAVGNLDLYALLTTNADNILDELYTLRSDDHQTKREVINNIIANGQSDMPKNIKQGTTSSIMKTITNCLGLHY